MSSISIIVVFSILGMVVITLLATVFFLSKKLSASKLHALESNRLLEHIPDLFLQVDQRGTVLSINPAGNSILAHPSTDYVRGNINSLLDKEGFIGFPPFLDQKISNETVLVFEAKKGNYLWFEFRIIPFLHNTANTQWLLFGRDISRRHQGEVNLKTAKKKAEQSDHLKSAFLANMSHEIRTPLNAIVGFANILLEDDTDKVQTQKYFNQIQHNSNLLISLVNDIIDISKIESNQLNIESAPMNINVLLKELNEIVEVEKVERGKTHLMLFLECDLPVGKAEIVCDPYRLRQVLINLLINAIKFTPKGFIQFGYRIAEGKQILFYVRDSGIGIAKEEQSEIFEHFRQLENQLTKRYGGTGLGLAISKRLVELMGGKIWVQSEPHKGASFFFTIPFVSG